MRPAAERPGCCKIWRNDIVYIFYLQGRQTVMELWVRIIIHQPTPSLMTTCRPTPAVKSLPNAIITWNHLVLGIWLVTTTIIHANHIISVQNIFYQSTEMVLSQYLNTVKKQNYDLITKDIKMYNPRSNKRKALRTTTPYTRGSTLSLLVCWCGFGQLSLLSGPFTHAKELSPLSKVGGGVEINGVWGLPGLSCP